MSNLRPAYPTDWMRSGENHHFAKLSDREVALIRRVVPALRLEGWSWRRLSEKFDCPVRTLRDIANYRRR